MKSNPGATTAFYTAWAAFALSGCASILPRNVQTVEPLQDVTVTLGDRKPFSLRKGQTFNLGSSPAIVEAPGRVGLILLPPAPQSSDRSNHIKISLKPLEAWDSGEFQNRSGKILSELLIAISEVQVLMASSNFPSALARLSELEIKYPGIAPLKFLRANCLFLSGDSTQAKAILERAIREFPNYAAGKDLYRALGGDPAAFPNTPGDRQ